MENKARNLSPFMCQEMFYDYLEDRLDPSTKIAFEQIISEVPDLEKELRQVKEVLVYCDQLSKTELSEPFLQKFKKLQEGFAFRLERMIWKNSRQMIKVAFEVVLVVFVVVGLFMYFPIGNWFMNKATDKNLTISEGSFEKNKINIVMSNKSKESLEVTSVSLSEENTEDEADEPSKEASVGKVKKEVKPVKAVEKTPEVKEKAVIGFVYSAIIKVGDSKQAAKKVKTKIAEIGGKKAGQVRLGWIKLDGTRYFHFVIPKKDREKFETKMSMFGKFKSQKLTHPRVMPDHQIRYIMHMEEDSELSVEEKVDEIQEESIKEPDIEPEPVAEPSGADNVEELEKVKNEEQ